MIEMPDFSDEEWYLTSIKGILKRMRKPDSYEKRIESINYALSEIVKDDDFSCSREDYDLFDKIILAPYKELESIYYRIKDTATAVFGNTETGTGDKKTSKFKPAWGLIYKIYDSFSSKGINTELINKYGIKCCPYCNQNYIFNRSMKNGRAYTVAQLDHFYPRDAFPIFAVSLYNLVPSCSACNHIKSTKIIGVNPHNHEYDFSNMRISYSPLSSGWIDDPNELKIEFMYKNEDKTKESMEKNINLMGIKESYNEHVDYVQEILKKAQIYGKETISGFLNEFPGLFSSESELISVIFGNYIETKDQYKRPLSKLTQDLLRELRIIG